MEENFNEEQQRETMGAISRISKTTSQTRTSKI